MSDKPNSPNDPNANENNYDEERYLNDPEYRRMLREKRENQETPANDKQGEKKPEPSEAATPKKDFRRPEHEQDSAGKLKSESAGGGQAGIWNTMTKTPMRVLMSVLGLTLVLSLIGGLIFFYYLAQGLPSIQELENPRTDMASFVLSRDGEVLDSYFVENRRFVSIEEISPHTVNALIATEDHRFFDHWGIDMFRTLAIPYHVLRGSPQGGSTISQQLARNLYRSIGREFSVIRKLREMITAVQIERNYTKQEIIEMYLNTVEFSNSAFGIESAARTHFNKEALYLDIPESAVLIGSLQAVSYFNPRRNPENATRRRNIVLRQMLARGFITEDKYQELSAEEIALDYQRPRTKSRQSRYFGEFVRRQVESWADENGYDLYRDGLRVRTTIDARMQQHAEQVMEQKVDSLQTAFVKEWGGDDVDDEEGYMPDYFEKFPHHLREYIRESGEYQEAARSTAMTQEEIVDSLLTQDDFVEQIKRQRVRLEGGFVALEPGTGHVLAWVGGTDYSSIQRDNVRDMQRQAGSTFKPFVYALAIDNGYKPYHEFSRFPKSFRDTNGNIWAPNDISISSGPEMVSLREALARSLNNVTIRLLPELAGAPDTDQLDDLYPAARQIKSMAQRVGIKSDLDVYPAIALGTAEVNLLELVNSYSTFANNGVRVDPISILRIEDREGNVLFEAPPQMQEEVISPITAYTIIDMLRGVISGGSWGHGTGVRLRNMGIRQDVAGKTGTTNDAADNWFIGAFPHVVAGAWIGGEDRRVRFPDDSYMGQGARTALPIVGEWALRVMNDPQANWSDESFEQPAGYVPDPIAEERNETENQQRGRIDW